MSEELLNIKQLPRDIEAEEGLLGSVLFDNNVMPEVLSVIHASDFYSVKNQLIFETMTIMAQQDQAIDLITLRSELERKDLLENVGDIHYLIQLSEKIPTATNAHYYAQIIAEKSALRKLYHAGTQLIQSSLDEENDIDSIVTHTEKLLFQIAEGTNKQGFVKISEVLSGTVEQLEMLAKHTGHVTGVSTGFVDLDEKTTGLHPDELIILAARPAVGKTAFVLNIAQNVATKSNGVVAIFSLEMGVESLVNRMLCAEGSIDAKRMREGKITNDEWDKLFIAMKSLSESEIYIDDTAGIKINDIRAKTRRLKQEKGKLDLIVIDYLQLIESSGRSRENRQQEVSEISRQLKKLAKELSVPVIALSQLSRGVEQRGDKRPVLSDIRESGSIEQDADIVAFLYREDYYHRDHEKEETTEDFDNNIIEVIIEKNRSGERGTVKLLFKKEYQKFSSVSFMNEQ